MTRLIDADALVEDLERVYEFYVNEIKEANENTGNYTSKFLPATAGAIDGLVDAEIAIHNAPTIEPDGDLISRQAAIRWVKTECNPYGKPTLDFESGKRVMEHLAQMPSAEPKTGEWIEESDNYGHSSYFCSRCGTQEGEPSGSCPNCGARMKGGDDE